MANAEDLNPRATMLMYAHPSMHSLARSIVQTCDDYRDGQQLSIPTSNSATQVTPTQASDL